MGSRQLEWQQAWGHFFSPWMCPEVGLWLQSLNAAWEVNTVRKGPAIFLAGGTKESLGDKSQHWRGRREAQRERAGRVFPNSMYKNFKRFRIP